MKKYFSASSGHRLVCEYPNKCPICNSSISPDKISETLNKNINLISILFTCPACGKGFVSHYIYSESNLEVHNGYDYYRIDLIDSFPKFPKQIHFDDYIENISSSFTEIYNQAVSAESHELNQISGIGYRKALEFLIKDYCIYRNNDKESEIKSMLLSQVITTYIDSPKIQNLAKASAWIGNDETHYVKKFEDKDINDLKKFINATVAFITYELISDEADDLVSSK